MNGMSDRSDRILLRYLFILQGYRIIILVTKAKENKKEKREEGEKQKKKNRKAYQTSSKIADLGHYVNFLYRFQCMIIFLNVFRFLFLFFFYSEENNSRKKKGNNQRKKNYPLFSVPTKEAWVKPKDRPISLCSRPSLFSFCSSF